MATCNTSTLLDSAKCFQCLSKKELQAVIAQLLCNISAAGTGGNTPVVYTADPNTEGLTPANAALPCVAYSADGSGSFYGWSVATATWV